MPEFIVTASPATYDALLALAKQRGMRITKEFRQISMFAIETDTIASANSLPARNVTCNEIHGCRSICTPSSRSPRMAPWDFEARGYSIESTVTVRDTLDALNLSPQPTDGDGVRIAFVGTGIDDTIVPGPVEHIYLTKETRDMVGHETAVAGLARAVAPAATIIDIHALENGEAKATTVIQGILEAYKAGAHLVNLSLGSTDSPSPSEPVTRASDLLAEQGLISVIAAGNNGNGPHTVEAPAGAQKGIVVGSINSRYQQSGFSGSGPDDTGRIRPDIVAMGGDLTEGIRVPTTGIMAQKPGVRGTSFSAGYISGFLAANRGLFPSTVPPWLAAATVLKLTADGVPEWKNDKLGWGWPNGKLLPRAQELLSTWNIDALRPAY